MDTKHVMPNANALPDMNDGQMANTLSALTAHEGIAQFRVGTVSLTILELTKDVTFATPFSDAAYEVFLQIQSGVLVQLYPNSKTPTGFTINLSLGVIATISYIAIGVPSA